MTYYTVGSTVFNITLAWEFKYVISFSIFAFNYEIRHVAILIVWHAKDHACIVPDGH